MSPKARQRVAGICKGLGLKTDIGEPSWNVRVTPSSGRSPDDLDAPRNPPDSRNRPPGYSGIGRGRFARLRGPDGHATAVLSAIHSYRYSSATPTSRTAWWHLSQRRLWAPSLRKGSSQRRQVRQLPDASRLARLRATPLALAALRRSRAASLEVAAMIVQGRSIPP